MSRVVLYRVKRPDGSYLSRPLSFAKDAHSEARKTNEEYRLLDTKYDTVAAGYAIEPVEYIPAAVARGLVEALKELRDSNPCDSDTTRRFMEASDKADAALAVAEEVMK